MRYFFIIGFIFLFKIGICQDVKPVDSLGLYINQLSWASFEISNNYISSLILKDNAKSLISLKDERKLPELLMNINDSSKTVAIHIILTQIIKPMDNALTLHYEYAKDSTISYVLYSYNGLTWCYENKRNKNHIQKNNIAKIEKYWQGKIRK
jgi:hypothetical protein